MGKKGKGEAHKPRSASPEDDAFGAVQGEVYWEERVASAGEAQDSTAANTALGASTARLEKAEHGASLVKVAVGVPLLAPPDSAAHAVYLAFVKRLEQHEAEGSGRDASALWTRFIEQDVVGMLLARRRSQHECVQAAVALAKYGVRDADELKLVAGSERCEETPARKLGSEGAPPIVWDLLWHSVSECTSSGDDDEKDVIRTALSEIDMDKYAKDIIKNHGTIAKCKELTTSDLRACGVPLFGEREKIINALKDLKPGRRSKSRSRSRSRDHRSSSSGSSGGGDDKDAIKAALKEIDMDKYAKDIIKNHGTIEKCKELTHSDLRTWGVERFGERQKIISALMDLDDELTIKDILKEAGLKQYRSEILKMCATVSQCKELSQYVYCCCACPPPPKRSRSPAHTNPRLPTARNCAPVASRPSRSARK
jgi:hypothetical protein